MSLPEPLPAPPASGPPRRPRYQPRRRTLWQRIPISVKFAAPLAVAGGAWLFYEQWQRSHVVLAFTSATMAVPAIELTFFPDQFAYSAPSPPPPIGRLEVAAGESAAIGEALVPGRAMVRYSGSGVGTGYASIELGHRPPPVVLHPPGRLPGRAGVPEGFWGFGLRSLGLRPVAGARVIGLGGGEHGVVLCEARTDADGRFELTGFDSALASIGVRVLAPGHAIAHLDWDLHGGREGPVVALVPTLPIAGRVELPAGLDATSLRVLARGLPGVEAGVAADGAFALDHVPPGLEPRLLLYDLPGRFTHRSVRAAPGQNDVRITVVAAAAIRGFVLDRHTQQPVAGATIWHEHGPAGQVAVTTAADGSFVLDRVPPGEVVLGAQYTHEDELGQQETFIGERRLTVLDGKDQDKVIVRVE